MSTEASTIRPAVTPVLPRSGRAPSGRLDLVRVLGDLVRRLFGAELARHRTHCGLEALDRHTLRDIGLS